MNEKFENSYIKDVDSMAPDMDKLWERIAKSQAEDNDITPFVSAAIECDRSGKNKTKTAFRSFTAAAAVFGIIICAVMALSDSGIASKNLASNDSAPNYQEDSFNRGLQAADAPDKAAFEAADEEAEAMVYASTGWDFSETCSDVTSYEQLDLAASESGIYTALSCNRDDEEFFVEQAVLADTEMFVDAKIISCETEDENSVRYTVQIVHLIADGNKALPEIAEIYSSTPYTLRNGREYLLPVSEDNGRLTVVFDSAPQIEFTEKREIVCHNGWRSLTADCSDIAYPKVYEDDYFYDRMNITAEASLERLFESWEELRAR